MADKHSNQKCAHPACNCMAAEGSKYCGAYCEGNTGSEILCNCGHSGCSVPATTTTGGSQFGSV
jgi:hypothetical protein